MAGIIPLKFFIVPEATLPVPFGPAGQLLQSSGPTTVPVWAGPSAGAGVTVPLGASGSMYTGAGAGVAPTWSSFVQVGAGASTRTWLAKGQDWISARDFGAVGDGVTNDTTAIQNAINAAQALPNVGGSIVWLGPGNFSIPGGLTVTGPVRLLGAGQNATFLNASHTDIIVVNMSGNKAQIEALTIYGKGQNNDTGVLGATQDALVVSAVSCVIRDVKVWGGRFAINASGTDCVYENVEASESYGQALFYTTGSNWLIRCKLDQSPTGVAATTSVPFPAWANGIVYTAGQIVTTAGFAIQCTVGGTSGGVAPTVKNYGINITDNTVTWQLWCPAAYSSFFADAGAGENHMFQCDMAGSFVNSVIFQAGVAAGTHTLVITDSVFNAPISVVSGKWFALRNCEVGNNVTVQNGYTGGADIDNNWGTVSWNLTIGTGVTTFSADNNYQVAGTLTIPAGVIANERAGTASNNNAPAGVIGETISANVAFASHISLTTATPANITSIALTPGDWDVWGLAQFDGGGTTNVTYLAAVLSTTSATFPTNQFAFGQINGFASTIFGTGFGVYGINVGPIRVSINATTTYYLVVQCGFTVSTCNTYGILTARRRR